MPHASPGFRIDRIEWHLHGFAEMQESHCPVCFGELEIRDVAPCDSCGGLPEELDHLDAGRHEYAEYEVFEGLRLVLCNFWTVDFGSIDPGFFEMKRPIAFDDLRQMRIVRNPAIGKDEFCPECRL